MTEVSFFEELFEKYRLMVRSEFRSALAEIQKPESKPDRIRIKEVSQITNYAVATLYSMVNRGQIPFNKSSTGRLYFSRKTILEWMERK